MQNSFWQFGARLSGRAPEKERADGLGSRRMDRALFLLLCGAIHASAGVLASPPGAAS
jgi:hypothetical protein